MVDRLSPIDRNPKTAWPVGQTAEKSNTPPLERRAELLRTIALHWKKPPLERRTELLGTIALHWRTPPLERRAELLGTIALLCFLEDLAYHARWVDAC
jgi:hypothetical protein